MVKSGSIDGDIVRLLQSNLTEVNGNRQLAQAESRQMYSEIIGTRT
jgi:hypothetical protein